MNTAINLQKAGCWIITAASNFAGHNSPPVNKNVYSVFLFYRVFFQCYITVFPKMFSLTACILTEFKVSERLSMAVK